LGYYSPTASNVEAIAILIEKDIIEPQEKVEKLITFEKEKFEENMEISDFDLEYEKKNKEMFKDKEIQKLIKKKKLNKKK
jgi:hypothetical protein